MKLLMLFAALAAPWLAAESITEGDRAYLLDHLAMTREIVVNSVRGLSKAQLLFKPAAHRWSVAQCIDHIARSEDYIVHKLVRGRLLASPVPVHPFDAQGKIAPDLPPPVRMGTLEDGLVIRSMTDRTRRAPATTPTGPPPVEEIIPVNDEAELAKVVERFLEVRQRTIEFVRGTKDDLRGHWAVTALPGYAPYRHYQDGYQWILRMSAHTERHLQQADEVRRDPKFPRR